MLFIYNRHAGKDRTWAGLSDMINTMTEQDYLITAYPTQCPGDAGNAITRWGRDYDRIVVAGGDGTLSQAISGLLCLEDKPPLGYIPVGSTNDFSRNLNLPSGLNELAATAAGGIPRSVDVGRFNGEPFVYVAAFGAFTEVSYDTPQKVKNLLGYHAYLLESLKSLASIQPYQLTVEYDGKTISGKFIYGMVSNTTSVGGLRNFPLGNPSLDDGLLEVTLISPPKDILDLELLSRTILLKDAAAASPILQTFSASRIKFICERSIPWTLDGEFGGSHQTVEAEVVPKAITIIHGK